MKRHKLFEQIASRLVKRVQKHAYVLRRFSRTSAAASGPAQLRQSDQAARKAYKLLHTHARHGYEPGDCHCDGCDVIVQELAEYFGIKPTPGVVYSPAALVRQHAYELGWR